MHFLGCAAAFAATDLNARPASAHAQRATSAAAHAKPAAHKRKAASHASRASSRTRARRPSKFRAKALVSRRTSGAHRSVRARRPAPHIIAQHAAIRKAAFMPARPSFGQAFGLHETPDALALRSSVAYVIDQNTQQSLFEKNSRAVLPIASITKLMTAMVALDMYLPLNEILEVTDRDRDYEKGTGSRLTVGSRLSREDMLHIALMASENRAAAALSRYYPGGRSAFIAAMNRKARALGMADTYFSDSTGLTSRNVSSARDLARMVRAAYRYPLIRAFSTDREHSVFTGRKTLTYHNTNALTASNAWEIGVQKTGFINEAGRCMVMQATLQNRPLIIVLLDSSGKYSRIGDAQRIRSWLIHMPDVKQMTQTGIPAPYPGT
nr:D-alanyl-D-alanine endopeptidase [Candidatus Glomeribacter gigasporarum]